MSNPDAAGSANQVGEGPGSRLPPLRQLPRRLTRADREQRGRRRAPVAPSLDEPESWEDEDELMPYEGAYHTEPRRMTPRDWRGASGRPSSQRIVLSGRSPTRGLPPLLAPTPMLTERPAMLYVAGPAATALLGNTNQMRHLASGGNAATALYNNAHQTPKNARWGVVV